jgi:methanobactin biosynthesis MbnP-like protein
MKKLAVLFCSICIAWICLVPCSGYGNTPPLQHGWITVIIDPVFNGAPLQLTDQYYIDAHGDTLSVDLLKFYITHLKLMIDSFVAEDTASHLVDAENPASLKFQVHNIYAGVYTTMQFMIGVDSIANTSGANGGDLDPAKGMYWAWNTGYIMAKLEGHSKVCKTLHHAFEFHVGGYQPPYNAARRITVIFPKNVFVYNGMNTIIRIKADVAAWFYGDLDLSKTNNVVIPGKDANIIADNYGQMFSAE